MHHFGQIEFYLAEMVHVANLHSGDFNQFSLHCLQLWLGLLRKDSLKSILQAMQSYVSVHPCTRHDHTQSTYCSPPVDYLLWSRD